MDFTYLGTKKKVVSNLLFCLIKDCKCQWDKNQTTCAPNTHAIDFVWKPEN